MTAGDATALGSPSAPPGAQPSRPVAPGTHHLELARLAIQESTHPDCDPLAVQTVIWLLRATNAVITALTTPMRPHGLSLSGFNVLMVLVNTPENELTPCDLAERLVVSRSSISGLLATLERKRLIQRVRSGSDGRRVVVGITAAGRELLDVVYAEHYAAQAQSLADLSHDDMSQLVQLLRHVEGATPPHLADS